jgi:hypothetical protein
MPQVVLVLIRIENKKTLGLSFLSQVFLYIGLPGPAKRYLLLPWSLFWPQSNGELH